VDLQVVFRGKLGSENDAVVVTTKDISEPTYLAYRNTTDYFSLDGMLYTKQQILKDPALFARVDTNNDGAYDNKDTPKLDPVAISSGRISIAGATDIIQFGTLDPENYVRVAYLADNGMVQVTMNVTGFTSKTINLPAARNVLTITNPETMSYKYNVSAIGVQGKLYFLHQIFGFKKYPRGSIDGDPAVIQNIPDPTPTLLTPIVFQ